MSVTTESAAQQTLHRVFGYEAFRRRAASHLDSMLALCETVRCRRAQLLTLSLIHI